MTVGAKIGPEWMLQKVTLWMLDSPEVRAQLSPLGKMLQPMETSVFFSVQWGEAGRLKQCQAAADRQLCSHLELQQSNPMSLF